MLALVRPSKTMTTRSPFVIAGLSAHTWVVAYEGVMIPGAVLGSAKAATNYATALAQAAGTPAFPCVRRLDSAGDRARRHSARRNKHDAIRGKNSQAAPRYGM